MSSNSVTRERVCVTLDPLMMGARTMGHGAVTLNDAEMGHLRPPFINGSRVTYSDPLKRLGNEFNCHLTLVQARGSMQLEM